MPITLTVEQTLLGYLSALGVHRAIDLVEPGVAGCWTGPGRYALDTDTDLTAYLLDVWHPPPLVSPWNGGSGWWPGDNTEGIEWIRDSQAPRLATYRATIAATEAVIARLGLVAKPAKEDKPALVAALRAHLPDDALLWLDAAVPSHGDRTFGFNPLLGTGGNNGRWEMSRNYMAALRLVLDKLKPGRSRALLHNALYREPAELVPMSCGHLSTSDEGFENPWSLVLACEGALMFAASAHRRLEWQPKRPIGPFTAHSSRAGYQDADEDVLGEIWTPFWGRPRTVRELTHVLGAGEVSVHTRGAVSAGRAVDGPDHTHRVRHALSGLDYMRATGEGGYSPLVDSLDRWIIVRRSGQAYRAVRA
jgi:CRISPR-associated protein Csx17